MFDLLNKFVDFTTKIANNQSLKGFQINNQEVNKFHDLRSLFEYLICYPIDHNFYNIDLINDILKQNKILQKTVVIGSKEYKKLLKEDDDLNKFVNHDVPYPIKIKTQKNIENLVDYYIYEKDDNFLYRYIKIEPNKDMRIAVASISDKIRLHFQLPAELSYEEIKQYGESCIDKTDDNQCEINAIVFKQYADTKSILSNKLIPGNMLQKMQFVDYLLSRGSFGYVDTGEKYVFKPFYDAGDYLRNEKIKKYQSGFLIVKKDELVDIESVNLAGILHRIRTLISHSRIYDYVLQNSCENDSFLGKIFLVDDRAVLVPIVLYNSLVHINLNNHNDSELLRKYIYCPPLKSALKTEQECNEYLSSCKIINITLKQKTSKEKLDCFMQYCLECFDEENQSAENLKHFLFIKSQKIFGNLGFEITPFKNIKLMLQKIMTNQDFFENKKGLDLCEEQKESIEFLVGEFYDFDIVKINAMQFNGKSSEISINSKHIQLITTNLFKAIDEFSKTKTTKAFWGLYKDEIYISLCAFLIFTNLIYNGFDDDFDNKNSTLSPEQKQELENKLSVELFSGFEYVNKNQKSNKPLEKVETLKQMKTIVSTVRNNIAHFMLRVKFSKSGDPKNHYLIFSYAPESNMPNLYIRIKIGDFLKVIMNPVFSKHKAYSENKIHTDNFDEIIDFVNQKLDEVEQLKNDL